MNQKEKDQLNNDRLNFGFFVVKINKPNCFFKLVARIRSKPIPETYKRIDPKTVVIGHNVEQFKSVIK